MTGSRHPEATSPIIAPLYVSAARPDRFAKAMAAGADVVVIDLEDSVPAHGKDAARTATVSFLSTLSPERAVMVRVNAGDTPWHADDVAQLRAVSAAVCGIRLPKVQSARDVNRVGEALDGVAVHALVESALGVEHMFDIARAPGVASIGLGEADLRAELSISAPSGLDWIRDRLVVAARAANLPAPLMSAWTAVKDLDGLARSCGEGKSRGFFGRSAIHPTQISVIRTSFAPTASEIAHAKAVLTALDEAADAGQGAVVLADGTMVDEAMRAAAERRVGFSRGASGGSIY